MILQGGYSFSVITGIVDVFILIFIFVITLYRYFKTKYIQFLYLSLEWLTLFLWMGFTTVSTLLLITPVSQLPIWANPNSTILWNMSLATVLGFIGYFSLLFGSIFLIIFVDSISRKSIDPVKAIIYGILVGLQVYAAFLPGQAAKVVSDLTFYAAAALWSYRAILWTYYSSLLTLHAPRGEMQRYAQLILLGSLLVLLTAFFIFTKIVQPDYGVNEALLLAGILLMGIPLYREPRLLYVLPFRASSLTVVNDSGLPIFTHSWVPESEAPVSHEILFGTLMHAISGILKESLGKGNLREIALEGSILLLFRHAQYPATFVLVSTKTSKSLVRALESFASKFTDNFREFLEVQAKVVSPPAFQEAKVLVESSFPFLPDFT